MVEVKGTVGDEEQVWGIDLNGSMERRKINEGKGYTHTKTPLMARKVSKDVLERRLWSCQKRVFGFLMILVQ